MTESIKQRIGALAVRSDANELCKLFNAVLADLGGTSNSILAAQYNALLTDVATMRTALATLATKLNADAGVTDTNYVGSAAATAVTVVASTSAAASLAA